MKKILLMIITISLLPSYCYAYGQYGRHGNMPDAMFYVIAAFILFSWFINAENPFGSIGKIIGLIAITAFAAMLCVTIINVLTVIIGKVPAILIVFVVAEYILHKIAKK